MPRLLVLLQYLLPQRLLTAAAAFLAEREAPAGLLIRLFIRRYRVDMSEALHPDPASYRTFNEFFSRALKPGARPVAAAPGALLCPADGAVSELGTIADGRLLQAKGQRYQLSQLLGGDALPTQPRGAAESNSQLAREFDGGSFITVYLSPRDYHRVHMPLAGRLLGTAHVPGKLFSVNAASAARIPGLFCRNERLVSIFDSEIGRFAVVMVGAMIVAGIRTVWDETGAPGRGQAASFGDRGPALPAGAEMGLFQLGSTVILLFPPGAVEFDPRLAPGAPLRMGGEIGRLRSGDQRKTSS